jgi:two-component system, cell cycle sensor histidine kinase and response regulator CckA
VVEEKQMVTPVRADESTDAEWDDEPSEAPGPPAAPAAGERPLTVLVVEDEPAVRGLVRTVLHLHGYSVLEAASAEEALALSASHPGRLPLLLTDVTMPEMSGRELARRLTELRPEMKVLYMSGHIEEVLTDGDASADPSFIQKPFSPMALAHKVRDLLVA